MPHPLTRFQPALIRRLLILLLLLSSTGVAAAEPAVRPLPPVEPRTPFIGIADAHMRHDLAWDAGARWQRILFYWDAIQPDWNGQAEPNRYVSDGVLRRDLEQGFGLVGVIGNPPRWATGPGSVPKNLDLPIDHPDNNWARFTRELARRYAGQIDTWVVWNEPDIVPGQPGSTWNGTPAEYWLLLRTAYKAIKQANPKATVAFAGTTYWADAGQGRKLFLERVLEIGAQDPEAKANGFFFDVVPFHIYSSPYKVYEVGRLYRDVLRRYGLEKPLWLAETNVVPHDDPHSGLPRAAARGTLDEQASFVIQTIALARAAGVERVQIYKMLDGPIEGGEPYGLVRNDGSPRPAYVALQTAAKHLLVPGSVSHQVKDGVARVVIDGGAHRTTVIWSTRPEATPARLPPHGTSARLIDKFGVERDLSFPADSPFFDITLEPATANTAGNARDYIIGGDPLIVVEDGVGAAIEGSTTSVFFPITGFNVSGPRLDYFRRRGELKTFGYPISRPFRLFGHDVQLFQRQAVEVRPGGAVGTLNLLDEFLPYTSFNGAVIPSRDAELTRTAPTPGSPGYAPAILRWLAGVAPDEWEGQSVRFRHTFDATVTFETAFPGGRGDRALLPGLNLELWGVPTSRPARDPANHDFVYQRFQRGVMHYDRGCDCTNGLLLAVYLKAILTGEDLPTDLARQAGGSRLFRQYDPAQPRSLARRLELPDSDLGHAFEREPLGR